MEDLATHVVIPDTQVKPGVPTEHLSWIGQYIVDKFAGRKNVTIVHLGDHYDLPSLSSYEKRGSKSMEGKRYEADINAGNAGMTSLMSAWSDYNDERRALKKRQWYPRMVFLMGNHEDRARRYIEDNPHMDGTSNLELKWNVQEWGWEVHDFLEPVFIDGIGYSHYWYNPMSGRPLAGLVSTRLKTLGHSFTMGHQQTLDYAIRFVRDKSQHGLVAGACYLHDEGYKGPQGNDHWRGIIVKHEVRDGSYDPMFVSLDYLRRRYA